MTTGEEFENFLNFAIKYKVKPKKPNIKQVIKKVRKELEEVAKELELPLENSQVLLEWCKQGGRYDDKLFVELIGPIYFPVPNYEIIWNKEVKQHIAISVKGLRK